MLLFVLSDVALAAVLVPVLVMVLTALVLIVVCARHWKNRYAVINKETMLRVSSSMTFTFCPSRKKSSEGTYDLPHWDRTGTKVLGPCWSGPSLSVLLTLLLSIHAADWWKSMKQLLPSKMVETEDSVRYSSSEVGRLAGRSAVPRIHAEPAGRGPPLYIRNTSAVSRVDAPRRAVFQSTPSLW